MHMLHSYLASNLEKKISASQVVVWYDPRQEFVSFVRELASDGGGSIQQGGAVLYLFQNMFIFRPEQIGQPDPGLGQAAWGDRKRAHSA
jgi:hypothetical protein